MCGLCESVQVPWGPQALFLLELELQVAVSCDWELNSSPLQSSARFSLLSVQFVCLLFYGARGGPRSQACPPSCALTPNMGALENCSSAESS